MRGIVEQLQRVAYVMFNDGWQSKEIAPLAGLEIITLRSRVAALEAENASLREQVEKAREALEPFAKYAVSDGFGLDSRASRTMEDILREQAKRPVLRPARALKDKEERG